jgi:hypothetical protein
MEKEKEKKKGAPGRPHIHNRPRLPPFALGSLIVTIWDGRGTLCKVKSKLIK